MTSSYIYSVATDFPSGIASDQLHDSIDNNGTIVPTCNGIQIEGDVVDIVFSTALSSGEEIELDSLVAAHVPISYDDYTTWVLHEEYSVATNAGSSVKGWQVRTLNTLQGSNRTHVTLSDNQFTLVTGTFSISASAPAYRVDNHRLRIHNVSDDVTELRGNAEYSQSSQTTASLQGIITVTSGPKTYRLEHFCDKSRSKSGLGLAVGATGENEVYAQVRIQKLA